MTWYSIPNSNEVEIYINYDYTKLDKVKIASFDLDWTLVKPNYGTFPRNENDVVIMKNRLEYLKLLVNNNFTLVIFTNQSRGIAMNKKRIENFVKMTGLNFIVFMSTTPEKVNSIYRKPNVGMWQLMSQMIKVESAFYCGDAAGRKDDFSDSDLMFAKNVGTQFYLPEELFLT